MGNLPEALAYLQRSTTRPGALRWVAPEQIDHEETFIRTTKNDIYSFGCVCLEGSRFDTEVRSILILLQVLSGKQPWSEIREDVAVIRRLMMGHKPGRPDSRIIDNSHWDLIRNCWSSLNDRPAIEEIVTTIKHFSEGCPQSQLLRDALNSRLSHAEIVSEKDDQSRYMEIVISVHQSY